MLSNLLQSVKFVVTVFPFRLSAVRLMGHPALRCLLLWILALPLASRATVIEWFSDKATHLDSTGNPMTSDFQFQLGVFSDDFQPTASNVADWLAHWNVADATHYVAGSQRFGSSYQADDNEAPFLVGAPTWIMGTRQTATGTEKILLRRTTWSWPVATDPTFPTGPTGLQWRVNGTADGLVVVLGSVNPGGSPFLMQTASVRSYGQWRELVLANNPLGGPGDDPDGDGISNLLEFVSDSTPLASNAPFTTVLSTIEVEGKHYLQLSIPRRRTHLANLSVQASSDLETWQEGPTFTEVVADDPFEWVVRDKTPLSSVLGGRRFMRLKAALPVE